MPDFNPLLSRVCLSTPLRVPGGPEAANWIEHVPFGMVLVEALRPSLLVELGTHSGLSYCAFCQAVRDLDLDTRCYAIDTWQGDRTSSRYRPEVLAELRAHHDPRYGDFSTLLRSTFDEALRHFSDNSIDLLHLDGCQLYEQVHRDFHAWLPKMSEKGIVLLHDIAVREHDFGVWKLWEEVSADYPHLAFFHGYGLGVLAVGAESQRLLLSQFGGTEEEQERLRAFFARLGQGLRSSVQPGVELQELRAELEDRERRLWEASREREALSADREDLRRELRAIRSRLSFQLLERGWYAQMALTPPDSLRFRLWLRLRDMIRRLLPARPGGAPFAPDGGAKTMLRSRTRARARLTSGSSASDYRKWAARCEAVRYRPERAQRELQGLRYRPVVSLVMRVHDADLKYLCDVIASVCAQYYPHWQLCVCDDATTSAAVRDVLSEYASRDGRIRVVRGDTPLGIAEASNRALAMCTGEFIGLLDDDDLLTPDALLAVASAVQDTKADLIYSDEDKLDERGRRCDPFFKPAWCPDLLLSYMYTGHFSVYRRSLVEEIGRFRSAFDGSQDYDLALRFTERTDNILHVPRILYHRRKASGSTAADAVAKPYAIEAGKRALVDALLRRGIDGSVVSDAHGLYRVRRRVTTEGKVSIVIPTRDRVDLLRQCIESVERTADYDLYEIVIIDNASREPQTLDYLAQLSHRVIRAEGPFNYSRLNNLAAREIDAEYLLLLNNDVRPIEGGWLSAMVEHAQRPEVGAVGAKLLYPEGMIQHAGIVLGIGGVAGHAERYLDARSGCDYASFTRVVRNYSAVTGACLMIRRQVFLETGGLDDVNLPVTFNDVDLGLRLRADGYLIVYTPHAVLAHHESATRPPTHDTREEAYLKRTWAGQLTADPYYHPSLTLNREDFSLDLASLDSDGPAYRCASRPAPRSRAQ